MKKTRNEPVKIDLDTFEITFTCKTEIGNMIVDKTLDNYIITSEKRAKEIVKVLAYDKLLETQMNTLIE